MTYSAVESSEDSGRPIELLRVTYLTNNWYFTTSEDSVTYDGHVYVPCPISHGSIALTGDVAKSQLTISVPQDSPVGELFRVQPPTGVVGCTLMSKHEGDSEAKVIWKGRIVNAEWSQPWLNLTSESVFSSLKRTGLRRKFATQCQLALYETGRGQCNANKNDHKVDYVVTAITGLTVTCSAATGKPVDFFAGGKVEWTHATNGYLEVHMVKSSDGSGNLVLVSQPLGLAVGATISTYPGCDHLPGTCNSKFNNSLNYGGMPYIPKKNPFGGSTLY